MTRRALVAAGVVSSGLAGCEWAVGRKTKEYGFRLKVEIFLAGRPVMLEAVRKSVAWEHYDWVPTSNRSFGNCFGDAVPLDIGRRTLFLTRAAYQQLSDRPREPTGIWTPASVYYARGVDAPPDWSQPQPGLALDLMPDELPVMVSLADNTDPQSIMIVRPEALSEHFPKARLGQCRVEWTRDRPTRTDVRKRLPWAYDNGRKPEIHPFVYADKNLFGI